MPRTRPGAASSSAGRAMHRVIQVAIDTGYLPAGLPLSRPAGEFAHLPQTRSWRSSPAARASRAPCSRASPRRASRHEARPGDTVIFSSRTIPGNEKAIGVIQNGLARHGVEIITDSRRAGACHRPSAARRAAADVRLGRAAHRGADARRGAPSEGACQAGARRRRAGRAHGWSTARWCCCRRTKPRIIDELPVGRLFRDGRLIVAEDEGRCASGASSPSSASSPSRSCYRARRDAARARG